MADSFDFIPGLGPKIREAADRFDEMAERVKNNDGVSKGATKMADSLENTLIPAAEKSRDKLKQVGEQEITRAAQRDAAKRTAQAIGAIGDAADGSQVKLKKWADRTDLAAGKQRALKERLKEAKDGLRSQLDAMEKAGAGQGKLTKAWEKGKDRLYAEFKQMGLSNKEAKKLAERYAGIKPKVSTKVEAPGLSKASSDTKTYVARQDGIDKSKSTSVSVKWGSSGKVALKRSGGMTYIANAKGSSAVLPGYTPGRDPYHFVSTSPGVPDLKLSGGEGILRPEVVRAVGSAWIDRANKAARLGGVHGVKHAMAFADGGIPTFTKAANATKPANSAGSQLALEAARKLQAEAQAALEKAAAAAAAKAAAKAAASGGDGGKGHASVRAAAKAYGAGYASHRDPAGKPSADMWTGGPRNGALGENMRKYHSKYGLSYVIANRRIASGRGGWSWRSYYRPAPGDHTHTKHVHVTYGMGGILPKFGHLNVAKYDGGGRLRPGWTMAYNGTGKHETVRTHEQERALRGGRGALVGNLTLQTSDRARDAVGELEYALHRIETGGPHA